MYCTGSLPESANALHCSSLGISTPASRCITSQRQISEAISVVCLPQVALYDVRRVSSNSSSVVNFGGSRTSQQLIASFNIAARAEKAAVEAVCSSSLSCDKAEASDPGHSSSTGCASSNSMRVYPYFADVQLNPVDCNLVAYVRLDYQVCICLRI